MQDELARRRAIGRSYSDKSVLGAKIKCGDSGCRYGEKDWHSTDSYKSRVWQCNGKHSAAFNTLIANKEPYITACKAAMLTFTDTTVIEAEMHELLREMEDVADLTKKCIDENSTTALDQDEYAKRYNSYVGRYENAKVQYGELAALRKEKQIRASTLTDS